MISITARSALWQTIRNSYHTKDMKSLELIWRFISRECLTSLFQRWVSKSMMSLVILSKVGSDKPWGNILDSKSYGSVERAISQSVTSMYLKTSQQTKKSAWCSFKATALAGQVSGQGVFALTRVLTLGAFSQCSSMPDKTITRLLCSTQTLLWIQFLEQRFQIANLWMNIATMFGRTTYL